MHYINPNIRLHVRVMLKQMYLCKHFYIELVEKYFLFPTTIIKLFTKILCSLCVSFNRIYTLSGKLYGFRTKINI